MHSLSDEQVDFIDEDIQIRGIKLKELKENLLDHICCVIENEITEEEDFYKFYESVLPRFFKKELSEIQVETDNLLKFKNFYTMKKLLKISGIATVAFTILGALFKTLHLPGTGMLIILGGFFFSIIYLPILILIKFKDDESKSDKLVFTFGLLLAIFMSIGLLFKLMHWPLATGTLRYTTMIFTFVYVPVYFITRVKRPELKFNTTVNSVLMIACGGIFYSLFDLSHSPAYQKSMVKNHIYIHENSERIFASNHRLIENKELDASTKEMHELSDGLNEELEQLVDWIIKEETTNNMASRILAFDKKVGSYNMTIQKLDLPELSKIEKTPLDNLDKVNVEIAMNVLARIQQQLAINENTFITNTLIMK